MNDRIDQSNGKPIVDSRANLFFLLQTLAKETRARAITWNNAEPTIPDVRLAAYKRNNGMI